MRLAIFTCVVLMSTAVLASTDTNGPNGINTTGSSVTGLDGGGISMGQVEDGRPAKKNNPDTSSTANDFVTPYKVFDNVLLISDSLGPTGTDAGLHAENVASVMISTDPNDPDGGGPRSAPKGVAPAAKLLAIAA